MVSESKPAPSAIRMKFQTFSTSFESIAGFRSNNLSVNKQIDLVYCYGNIAHEHRTKSIPRPFFASSFHPQVAQRGSQQNLSQHSLRPHLAALRVHLLRWPPMQNAARLAVYSPRA